MCCRTVVWVLLLVAQATDSTPARPKFLKLWVGICFDRMFVPVEIYVGGVMVGEPLLVLVVLFITCYWVVMK